MRFKKLAAYPVALTLLVLALLACDPANESLRQRIGNMVAAATRSEVPTQVPVETGAGGKVHHPRPGNGRTGG